MVWKVLTRHFFQRWVGPEDAVLDLGAGFCEFINNISAGRKYAMGLNPVTQSKAGPDVAVYSHDASVLWPLPAGSVDLVFACYIFEHLESKKALTSCLAEIHRVLRLGRIFIALGPNIRYCHDVYWDFIDHYLPLSDKSLVEAVEVAGLRVDEVIPRFLPFTMSGKRLPPLFLVRLYLKLRFVWPVFGKQMLIVACNHV